MFDTGTVNWASALDRVCREGLITPRFQPIVDLVRGTVSGFEGLARIEHPEIDAGPEKWFSEAAWRGLTGRLEATALAAMLDHHHELPVNCFLSVNLSPAAVSSPDVQSVLNDHGSLANVVIEITEQSPVEDYDVLLAALGKLRARGAMVAVDDTGVGYAGIRHLLTLRPEIVKLDRSLVSGIDHDPSRAAAVAALGAFAGELDAWIVAEGVERVGELERLHQLRVPLAQGYYLARPGIDMRSVRPDLVERARPRIWPASGPLTALAHPAVEVTAPPFRVLETSVLLDEARRPVCVYTGEGRWAIEHPAMAVQASDELRSVALRAMARPPEDRFTPLCLCDEQGRLRGLVSVDGLLEALARD